MAAAALALLSAPGLASATGPVDVIGPPEVHSLVESFLVPTLPRPVRVRLGACPDGVPSQGCHIPGGRMDTIWLNPEAGGLDLETTAHEMGHVFENYMWDLRWERRRGTAFVPKIFGRIANVLFENPGAYIFESTDWSEWFAESYSSCARASELTETINGFYGFHMSPEQHDLICPMIDEMGQKYEEAGAAHPVVAFRRAQTIG